MIYVFIPIIALLLFYNIKFKPFNQYYDDCLSKEQTSCINGLFVIIIFISHFKKYIATLSTADSILYRTPLLFSQLVVVSFLFYSGFGLMESYKKKGQEYISTFPQKRFLKVFLDFALALLLFLLVQTILGKTYSVKHILLSFTGLVSIGNSCWYMFAIFTFYIIVYLSFTIFRNNKYGALILATLLSIAYMLCFHFLLSNFESYFYDTYLCLIFGMWFSVFKDYFMNFINKWYTYISIFLFLITSLFVLYFFLGSNPFVFNVISIIFSILLVMVTMKIKIQNPILAWIGKHTFWIYIIQRLPMIVLRHLGLNNVNTILFFFTSLVVTLLLSWLLQKLSNLVQHFILKKA